MNGSSLRESLYLMHGSQSAAAQPQGGGGGVHKPLSCSVDKSVRHCFWMRIHQRCGAATEIVVGLGEEGKGAVGQGEGKAACWGPAMNARRAPQGICPS